jgi:hypothetical protein
MNGTFGFIACLSTITVGCVPRGDLDAAASDSTAMGSDHGGVMNVELVAGTVSTDGGSSGASAGQAGSSAGQQAGGAGSGGGAAGLGGGGTNSAGATVQQELPIYLADSPLTGEISITGDAVWNVDGTAEPTFEIHTPSANYWLVKSLGTIVSLSDTAATDARQWIGYSSFRPSRSVPSFASSGLSPTFTTVLDSETQTPQHVRLRSETATADFRLLWDFYLTHVTVSIETAPPEFAFSYRGVPAGSLDGQDSLLTADGLTHAAFTFYTATDFAGKPEWVAITDPDMGRALFLIQHYDNDVPDKYQVKDNDSAFASFGREQASYSARYSLGLLDKADFSSIESRVKFVDAAMR